jgi:hypothetical protein
MGVGFVIPDHTGDRAINLAKDEGFPKIIINSIFLVVVNRVISEHDDISLYGPIIHDIR